MTQGSCSGTRRERQDGRRRVAARRRGPGHWRPAPEPLEGRWLLTTINEFSGPTAGSGPVRIGLGPDRHIWFTEFYGSRIGRITPLGTITEFSTGITPNSRPGEITVGPDGDLWFTEISGNRIGRITTDGTVTEFST